MVKVPYYCYYDVYHKKRSKFSENLQLIREAQNKQYVRFRISCISIVKYLTIIPRTCLTPSLHNKRFMSQAREMRHFAQSAKCETRGKEKR